MPCQNSRPRPFDAIPKNDPDMLDLQNADSGIVQEPERGKAGGICMIQDQGSVLGAVGRDKELRHVSQ